MMSFMLCLVCLIYNSYYALLCFNIPPKYLMIPFSSRTHSRFHQQLMSERKAPSKEMIEKFSEKKHD